jgi:hypothetical protein
MGNSKLNVTAEFIWSRTKGNKVIHVWFRYISLEEEKLHYISLYALNSHTETNSINKSKK